DSGRRTVRPRALRQEPASAEDPVPLPPATGPPSGARRRPGLAPVAAGSACSDPVPPAWSPPAPDLARVEAASRSLSAQPGVLQARQHSCLLQRGQTTLNALIWEPLRAGAAGQGGHERSPNRVRKAGS